MKQKKIRHIRIGEGNKCPKCNNLMERRKHNEQPKKTWYYVEWDWCQGCKHLQHYDEFKSPEWVEAELQDNH